MSFVLVAARAAVILGGVLASLQLMRKAAPASRRTLLVAAFAAVLVLPIATALLPALHLRGHAPPAAVPSIVLVREPIDEVGIAALAPPSAAFSPAVAPALAPGDAPSVSPLAIAGIVWALGAFAVLARLALGHVRARRLVRAARFIETLDVAGRPVEIRISHAIETPAVTGLLVPVVLLPRDAETWSAERRSVVLAHELAHVASHDCLGNTIAQLAVAVHWFDPLAWIAARRLRMERELAADDRVIDGGVLASSYAAHLLALATASDQPMPAGALAMAEPAQVSVRIRALLAPHRRTRLGRIGRAGLFGGALVLAAVVACATPEREAPPDPTPAAPAHAATIDPRIQTIVDRELDRMETEWAPCAAIVIVLDPATGRVLAASHRGGTETTAELAANRPFAAGSTVKPLVIAAALEEGVIAPTDRFDASPAPFAPVVDFEPHGTLDVAEILAVSSNVGLARIFDKLGGTKLAAYTKRFHLASAPATIPDGPAGAPIAIGGTLSSTPLEIAAAFAVLANGGVYHAPVFAPGRDEGERVVRAETATTVLSLLEGVTGEHGTGKAARVPGVRVAGKTGTAHLGSPSAYYASFVGAAPLDHPRYVIFVGAETPRDGGSGGQVAAPVFGRVMTQLLAR